MEFNSFGSEKNGNQLYIKIFAGGACIRVLELEQSFKYKHDMPLNIFDFTGKVYEGTDKEKGGFYNFVRKIRVKKAFDEIPEVREFAKIYFNELYLEMLNKSEKDFEDSEGSKDIQEPKENTKKYI